MCKCKSTRYLYLEIPEIFKQIHPTKNENLNTFELTVGSHKKIWWLCEKQHPFYAEIANRAQNPSNIGCPYCHGNKVCLDNCLATSNPRLSSEWHPTKNGNLTPFDVTYGSNKKVWWKCGKEHEFYSTINDRNAKESECPYCTNQKVCLDNCLATLNPELSLEWHPTKNENLTPFDVVASTNKKAWWKCEKGHEWKCRIFDRNNGSTCKKCNKIGTSDIERKFFYYLQLIFTNAINGHKIKNDNERDVEVDVFVPEINLAIEYDGVYFHKKEENINRDIFKNNFLKEKQINLIRIRESGLLSIHDVEFIYDYKNKKSFKNTLIDILNYVSKNFLLNEVQKQKLEEVINMDFENHVIPKGFFVYPLKKDSLLTKNPTLSKQWHPELNGDLKPEHVSCGSDKEVWWECGRKHIWKAKINPRNNGSNCPYCENFKACIENCLETLNPTLAKEWNLIKNGTLTPYDVTSKSGKKVWWICDRKHEWEATVGNRNHNETNCPYCTNQKACIDNCLAALKPELIKEWHPVKNGTLTPFDVTYGSEKKIWWICDRKHEWEVSPNGRTNNESGCPYCANQKVCLDNCLATLNPIISSEWHPVKNGTLTPFDVTAGSNKKAWWKCEREHEWISPIHSRHVNNSQCPTCRKLKHFLKNSV